VYADELGVLASVQASEQRRERLLGVGKLLLAALTLVGGGLLVRSPQGMALLLIPIAAFVVMAIAQEMLIARIETRTRAIRFYKRGMARLNHTWAGSGESGARFLQESHPYARDLDIFGDSSLYQFLCAARTRSGEETLAHWLMAAAPVGEINRRQEAARELAGRLKFREKVSSSGEDVRRAVDPEKLSSWGEQRAILSSTQTRIATTLLAVLWIASIVLWAVQGSPLPAMLMSLLNFAYSHWLHVRLDRAAKSIEKAADELRVLAEVLGLIEREEFAAPKLIELHAGLKREGSAPSGAIRRLARMAELIESRHSLFARPLDLVTFWSAQVVFVAERWQRKYGAEIRGWLATVGEMEALASLAAFAFEHHDYAWPEFVAEGPLFECEGVAHPLLKGDAVENDVAVNNARSLMILSGPNMAGKSTFIRCMGVSAVLAQCGAPVRARRLRMSPLQVAASICILDSLSGGVSRFYAEIRRVKMIAESAGRASFGNEFT